MQVRAGKYMCEGLKVQDRAGKYMCEGLKVQDRVGKYICGGLKVQDRAGKYMCGGKKVQGRALARNTAKNEIFSCSNTVFTGMLGSQFSCFIAIYVLRIEFRVILGRRILQKPRFATDNLPWIDTKGAEPEKRQTPALANPTSKNKT